MTDHSLIGPAPNTLIMLQPALRAYLAGKSANTKRAYQTRVEKFAAWRDQQLPADLFTHLEEYIEYLQGEGLSPRSVQAHINTLKGLVETAVIRYGDDNATRQLPRLSLVKPPPVRGERQGTRLTTAQRQALINAPGTDTHKGRRDTSMLALMSVCGLRRSELRELSWEHITELDGHKVLQNLVGKHGRVRTVKLPVALWRRIVNYGELALLERSEESPVFVSILKGDRVQPDRRIPSSSIAFMVNHYIGQLREEGWNLPDVSPHDLRRTAASRARKAGASIEQVQVMLGHASPQTTSTYIGETLDLDDHAVDYAEVEIP